MKILVYEHTTSGALSAEPLPISLIREGDAILQAILNDLAGNAGVQSVILRDSRLDIPLNVYRCHYICNLNEFRHRWLACLDYVDAILPIAPETDGLLAEIQTWVLKTGKRLLGCHPEATAIATSKMRTAQSLSAARLATAPTIWLRDWQPSNSKEGALICKPDDGAGCTHVLYFKNAEALNKWKQKKSPEAWGNWVVQPYFQGIAASLCLLCSKAKARLLCANQQQIQIKGNAMRLTSIKVNAMAQQGQDHKILQGIADSIASTLPGLWGFVGVDLIFAPQPIILEINPRLTTSYVGLREAYGANPATWLLALMNKGIEAVELPPNLGHKITLSIEKEPVVHAISG